MKVVQLQLDKRSFRELSVIHHTLCDLKENSKGELLERRPLRSPRYESGGTVGVVVSESSFQTFS